MVVGGAVFALVGLVFGLVLLFGLCCVWGLVVGSVFLFTSVCWVDVGLCGCGCGVMLGLVCWVSEDFSILLCPVNLGRFRECFNV